MWQPWTSRRRPSKPSERTGHRSPADLGWSEDGGLNQAFWIFDGLIYAPRPQWPVTPRLANRPGGHAAARAGRPGERRASRWQCHWPAGAHFGRAGEPARSPLLIEREGQVARASPTARKHGMHNAVCHGRCDARVLDQLNLCVPSGQHPLQHLQQDLDGETCNGIMMQSVSGPTESKPPSGVRSARRVLSSLRQWLQQMRREQRRRG